MKLSRKGMVRALSLSAVAAGTFATLGTGMASASGYYDGYGGYGGGYRNNCWRGGYNYYPSYYRYYNYTNYTSAYGYNNYYGYW